MNNSTIQKTKNVFNGGLVMDFSPDNTSAEVLTSALNATLLTFNGNEMSLLNDMGNGRVETARLPEGYIPVGTCEFGDIIYIVSYNPLTNKSLIGCFPSPERNISSEEMGLSNLIISNSEFLKFRIDPITKKETNILTGKLVASSVKKIFDTKLNPGDKYLIASDKNFSSATVTDTKNTANSYGSFPKLVRIHVASIEESGKINYLDNTVRWYNTETDNYIIPTITKGPDDTKLDIDSYRSTLSSGYSIFLSKVSGKLALIIELERISGFSCTYDIYSKELENISAELVETGYTLHNKNYEVYWNINWESPDVNISPKYIVLTKGNWISKLPYENASENAAGKYYIYNPDDPNKLIGTSSNILYKIPNNDEESKIVLPYSEDNDNYWYSEISRSYTPEYYNETYENFINNGSYTALEKAFIESILGIEGYKDLVLNKLSVQRNADGTPSGEEDYSHRYYINASFKDGKNYKTINNGIQYETASELVKDDIVNNYFKTSIYKKFGNIVLPYKQDVEGGKSYKPDLTNMIYNYEITPAMPYGLLDDLAQEGYIDFSKVGSGEVNLTKWKYYTGSDLSTLNIGFEIYPEQNKGVDEIVLEFYDNQENMAAAYHISNKASYSGSFMENIPLNGNASYKMNAINYKGESKTHRGTIITKKEWEENGKHNSLCTLKDKTIEESERYNDSNIESYHLNDCGTLYSNVVYFVKIIVKYCSKDALGNYNTDNDADYRYFYRWFWTNTMFNEYYYTVEDFDGILASLTLDVGAEFSTTSYYNENIYTYESKGGSNDNPDGTDIPEINGLSANVRVINLKFEQDGKASDTDADLKGNIKADIKLGLLQDYNTFNLNIDTIKKPKEQKIPYISTKVFLGKSTVTSTDPQISSVNSSLVNMYDLLNNNDDITSGKLSSNDISTNLMLILGYTADSNTKDLWEYSLGKDESVSKYEGSSYLGYKNNYKNKYGILFPKDYSSLPKEELLYLNSTGEEIITLPNCSYYLMDGLDSVNLTISAAHFSKYSKLYTMLPITTELLTPIINTQLDLDKYGMVLDKYQETKYTHKFKLSSGDSNGFDFMKRLYWYDNSYVDISGIIYIEGEETLTTKLSELNSIRFSNFKVTELEVNIDGMYDYFTGTIGGTYYYRDLYIKIEHMDLEPDETYYRGELLPDDMMGYFYSIPILINNAETSRSSEDYETEGVKFNKVAILTLFTDSSGRGDHSGGGVRVGLADFLASEGGKEGSFTLLDAKDQRWAHYTQSNESEWKTFNFFSGGKGNINLYEDSAKWNAGQLVTEFRELLGKEDIHLKDFFLDGITMVLFARDDDANSTFMITRNNSKTKVNETDSYYNYNNYSSVPLYTNINPQNSYFVGFVMKDKTGNVHVLNELYLMKLGAQTVEMFGRPRLIGNIILSALSNMYVKSPNTSTFNIKTLTDVIFLEDNLSIFSKDFIIQSIITINDPEKPEPTTDVNGNHNNILLMLGIPYDKYLNDLQENLSSGKVAEESKFTRYNVDFKINSILKTIPLLFNFDYILPNKVIPSQLAGTIAILMADEETIRFIPSYNSTTELYTTDTDILTGSVTARMLTSAKSYLIENVSLRLDGSLLYEYNKNYPVFSCDMNKWFNFDDEILTLSNSSPSPQSILAFAPSGNKIWGAINCIVLHEFLNSIGKYAE